MLQHESSESPGSEAPGQVASTPPAQIRVTAEELAAAINALEASKDAAARHLAGTVPIGQVVEEMKLEATPEEIWDQVQKQRAQAALEKAKREEAQREEAVRVRPMALPILPTLPVLLDKHTARRLGRGWRGIKGWVWILFWCCGGGSLFSVLPHLLQTSVISSGQTITINSDGGTQTINAQGKDIVINSDSDKVTLHGTARSVEINGDFDTVTGEAPQSYVLNGANNTVKWQAVTKPSAP